MTETSRARLSLPQRGRNAQLHLINHLLCWFSPEPTSDCLGHGSTSYCCFSQRPRDREPSCPANFPANLCNGFLPSRVITVRTSPGSEVFQFMTQDFGVIRNRRLGNTGRQEVSIAPIFFVKEKCLLVVFLQIQRAGPARPSISSMSQVCGGSCCESTVANNREQGQSLYLIYDIFGWGRHSQHHSN